MRAGYDQIVVSGIDLEQAGSTNVAVDESFATAERFSTTAHPGPRSRRRSAGFVAELTGIVIVRVYACGGMGQNRTRRCP